MSYRRQTTSYKPRTICIVTGSRAEYGLLYWLIKEIQEDSDFELQIIGTGMHLSPEFGLTYRQIEDDGFKIDKKIEMLLSSDTPVGISKSMGLGIIGFAEAYEELNPDIVVLLGDRFEIYSAVAAAMIARIPIAHLHGGETTEGAFDEAIRHSITKMSHLHFTSTEEYRKRVIQLGENPERVFNVGAIGIENIQKLPLLSQEDLESEIGFSLGQQCLLVTYHPVTLEQATAQMQFQNLLNAIDTIDGLHVIFTKSNADTEGRIINRMIDEYVSTKKKSSAISFTSMGQLRYLNAMKHVDAVVGNSSSGIVEAPSFKTPTVNIGDRQKGRIQSRSVINCSPTKDAIIQALKQAFSPEFGQGIQEMTNPYGKENTARNIKEIIKYFDLTNILKKEFYDIKIAD
ncbi:MAG TPA: UDP-N-acetylglucosamine 2-epimerase [Candidatus Marinimicrobia bacterium]|jgi:GDP/UDP-N,N'-diacetylbacillosamine 2-epimerase (hydrolysing)|nr:UDP-N-acetylglucosamine 2-epimerase (hydrolyzing) [Parcubacteria group bacterium]MEE1506427.1 UDP-N-acetylglucosamine 2-epimerase [Candidatus Neomarinimicrobiota bacterium]HJL78903.1 UDP-N-acetylglucosamine 2-epimerase [Candidatus Neomarinimicrobiota bacterium]|tara:strand:- start:823 stop:2025 length:1203 start_codon:yes stop_codon:yes gene_type:complete